MNTEEKDRVEAVTKALTGARPGTTFTLKLSGKIPLWDSQLGLMADYGMNFRDNGRKMVVQSLSWARYGTRCWNCAFINEPHGGYSVPEEYMENTEL